MLELEGRVSELQCDNLRMEQRLLDMEYSSYSTTKRIEGSGMGGMTLIDDVLRDYSRHTQLVQNDKSNDVDINAKRKSIVDVENETSDKVCMCIQCTCLVCIYSSNLYQTNHPVLLLYNLLYKRSRRLSSSVLEPGTAYYYE
jgi:hypothetical protein